MIADVDPIDDLGAAVDWYVEAIRPAKTIRPVGASPDRDRDLELLEARIAPDALPRELRWFWTTWDPSDFDVLPTPRLFDPNAALDTWTMLSWEEEAPRALLPIGYEHQDHLQIDLSGLDDTPASVWFYTLEGDLRCAAPSLAALIRAGAERIEVVLAAAEVTPRGQDLYTLHPQLFDGPEFGAIMDRHFSTSSVQRVSLSADAPDAWPARWHDAQLAMTGGSQPRGRTHTVAEFVGLLASGHPRVRLRGTMAQMSGRLEGGNEDLMRLTDETGAVELAVPPHVLPPGWRLRRETDLEVEAVGRGAIPERPEQRQPAASKVAEMEQRYGSWRHYLVSSEGMTDPELAASLAEHLEDLRAYKDRIPLVERADLVDP